MVLKISQEMIFLPEKTRKVTRYASEKRQLILRPPPISSGNISQNYGENHQPMSVCGNLTCTISSDTIWAQPCGGYGGCNSWGWYPRGSAVSEASGICRVWPPSHIGTGLEYFSCGGGVAYWSTNYGWMPSVLE